MCIRDRIYSNYYLLIGSVRQVLDQVFAGITASVGNLGATEDQGKIREIFETAFFIGQWLYGFAAICLYELLNPFVELAFGRQYLFERSVVMILCINFFINGTRKAVLTFRDSMGLFWFDRYKALAEAALNLVLSILLVRQYQTLGVFIGTFLSTILTSVWVEPFVLYRRRLHLPVHRFYLRYLLYAVCVGAVWIVTDLVCGLAEGSPLTVLLIRLPLCVVLPNLLFFMAYGRTKEWKRVLERLRRIEWGLSLIHISEPTRQAEISYAVFCLKKKKKTKQKQKID